jgi:hypothetical protein
LGLTPDWCPKVQVKPGYSNLDARIEIASRTEVPVTSLVENSVREQLMKLGQRAAGAIK